MSEIDDDTSKVEVYYSKIVRIKNLKMRENYEWVSGVKMSEKDMSE